MALTLETIISLCKRRGFIFQGSEIYGGLAATYDYGPLGVELKRNVKDAWWRAMVQQRRDMEGLDASILMNPNVWRASGHVDSFTDPMVDCKDCKKRFRADHLEGYAATYKVTGEADSGEITTDLTLGYEPAEPATVIARLAAAGTLLRAVKKVEFGGAKVNCPECGGKNLTAPRLFNLMFSTHVGPVQDGSNIVFLRPETAQGIFVNFANVQETSRRKLPFGIAQMGKSFRNEVTTKAFIFRTLEFEQMEIEFFCKPGTDEAWHRYWIQERYNWYLRFGLRRENLRSRPHEKDELAHYAKGCADLEYKFPMGWSELEGIANRTDFDLKQHQEHSKKDLTYFDQAENTRYIPYVIEPSAGVDRSVMAFLIDSFEEEDLGNEKSRTVLRLHPALAPIKVAVLPLLKNKPEIVELANRIADDLKTRWVTRYDDTANIGKLYRRQDEVGTPYCVTIDPQSIDDAAVTVRERDSMAQERVPAAQLAAYLGERLIMNPPRLENLQP